MIDLIFALSKEGKQATAETVVVTIFLNKTLRFSMMKSGTPTYSYIEGLKLSLPGIIKEFPDLEGKPVAEIKRTAVERMKEKIRNMNSMLEIKDYLKEDLAKHGYKLIMSQRKGHRPVREK